MDNDDNGFATGHSMTFQFHRDLRNGSVFQNPLWKHENEGARLSADDLENYPSIKDEVSTSSTLL